MANHLSAWKRIRQNSKRRVRNIHFKSFMRSRIRAVRESVASGNQDAAKTALSKAVSAISSVASKGVIHKNTASRRISRLSRAVHGMLRRAA